MNSLLLDNLQGIRQDQVVRARGRTELARFSASAEKVAETQLVIMRTWSWVLVGDGVFAALGSVIVLYIGGRDVLAGTMTYGSLVQFLLYVAMFYAPVIEPAPDQPAYQAGPRLERARGGNSRRGAGEVRRRCAGDGDRTRAGEGRLRRCLVRVIGLMCRR